MSSVAVIVVNYNIAEYAIKAVNSVLANVDEAHTVEVHLVDNASPDGDAETLSQTHEEAGWGSRVTLWLETENHGFGRGNNVVLNALEQRAVPPDYIFLLNPDAHIENDVVAILADTLDRTPKAGAVGASIHDGEGPVTAAFRFPSMTSELLRMVNFGPLDKLFGGHQTSLPADHPAGPVDWVSGASVMFRFAALRQSGFFDPGFFLYFEEVELMKRLRKHGWSTLYAPEAQVRHLAGMTTGGGGRRREQPAYLYESWRHYFAVTKGRGAALFGAGLMMGAAVLNILHLRLRGKQSTVPKGFFGQQWRLVIRPLLTKSSL